MPVAAGRANRGDQARREGKAGEAVSIYRRALQVDSNAPRAHNGLGLIHYTKADYSEALWHFDVALKQYPKQIQIRYNRTLALLKLKRMEEARQEITEIKKLETENEYIFSMQLEKIMSQLSNPTK